MKKRNRKKALGWQGPILGIDPATPGPDFKKIIIKIKIKIAKKTKKGSGVAGANSRNHPHQLKTKINKKRPWGGRANSPTTPESSGSRSHPLPPSGQPGHVVIPAHP